MGRHHITGGQLILWQGKRLSLIQRSANSPAGLQGNFSSRKAALLCLICSNTCVLVTAVTKNLKCPVYLILKHKDNKMLSLSTQPCSKCNEGICSKSEHLTTEMPPEFFLLIELCTDAWNIIDSNSNEILTGLVSELSVSQIVICLVRQVWWGWQVEN